MTISLSDKQGHFLFNQVFDPVCQWPYHGLTDGFFIFFSITFLTLNISDHTTVSYTGFKKTRSVRPWYGHRHPGVKCLTKKPRSDRLWYDHWGLLNSYGYWWVTEKYQPICWFYVAISRFFCHACVEIMLFLISKNEISDNKKIGCIQIFEFIRIVGEWGFRTYSDSSNKNCWELNFLQKT